MSESMVNHIDDVLSHCIHCGMCLPVCPTYALTSREESSPRGRIRLIRSVQDGSLGLSGQFVEEMNFCLDCQACQTACPAGVQYGALVEDARRMITEEGRESFWLRSLKRILLRGVLASKSRTKLIGHLLRLYGRTGLREAVERSGIMGLFSDALNAKLSMLPAASEHDFDEGVAEVTSPDAPKRGRVAFLSGCIMNVAFSDVHRDAMSVLLKNGFEVVVPKLQVCCGSLHGHNGDVHTAKILARKNIEAFEKFEFDALIVDSAGCSAFLKEYGMLLAGDPRYASRASLLESKTKDIMEFLVEVGYELPQPQPCEGLKPSQGSEAAQPSQGSQRITYHEACHLVHTQKISRQPRSVLQSIPGAELVELPEATWCCGSAGIYNVTRYDDSMKFLERKMNNIASTNADVVVTANPGCHLQILYGIRKFGLNMEVKHPVSLLAQAYRERDGSK